MMGKKYFPLAFSAGIVASFFIFFSSCTNDWLLYNQSKKVAEKEILRQLDLAYNHTPNEYYPIGGSEDIKYNFFLDLEDGYCIVAGSRIHLYADSTRWALVFEKSGYQTRGRCAEIVLDYFGNCVDYPVEISLERKYITNSRRVPLIDQDELDRIENRIGNQYETFELIGSKIKQIKIRDVFIPFDNDYRNYEKVGINVREYGNPNKLIDFGSFIRYLNETNPSFIHATEQDIKQHIPMDLPKIMTIDKFHFVSNYDSIKLPSMQETFQLLAKVLVTRDTSCWKPSLKANNHWSNWESGNL